MNWFWVFNGKALGRIPDIIAYQVHDSIDVDAAGHMAHEVNERTNAREGQDNAEGQRKVGNKRSLVLRSDRSKHH